MILSLAKVLALAAQCGAVSVSQLIALPGQLHVESQLDTTAINDNTLGRSFHPADLEDAVAFVQAHSGDSIDAGLLQINNTNWPRLGLDAVSVFDPGANVCAGLQVLREGLSVYNTGRVTTRGLAYADRVFTAEKGGQHTLPKVSTPRSAASEKQHAAAPHQWNAFPDPAEITEESNEELDEK
jgi:type IV secretion system protein VirB1